MPAAVVYLRVSTRQQEEEGYGLPAQGVACHAYAEAKGYEIVAEYAEAHSGRTPNRPQIQQALADAKAGKFTDLIVARTDRLGRDDLQPTISILEAAFTEAGITIHYADEGGAVDLANPAEWLTHGILKLISGYANLERVVKSRAGKYQAVKEGSIQSGKPPYGYRKLRAGRKSILEVNELEAKVVRQIYKWFNEGIRIYVIAGRLKEAGIKKEYPWTRHNIRDILKSETYAGRWWYGVGDDRVQAEVPAIVSPED